MPFERIRFNQYMNNLEFVLLNKKYFSFWRISEVATLQYQYGDYNLKDSNINFLDFNFSPPLGLYASVLLLLTVDDGSIIAIDTKTNGFIYNYKIINQRIPLENFNLICCINSISLVIDNKIQCYKLKSLKDINSSNLFKDDYNTFEFDSNIISYDVDNLNSQILLLTKKAVLYYLDIKEEAHAKLFNFPEDKNEINNNFIICSRIITNQSNYNYNDLNYNNINNIQEAINKNYLYEDNYNLNRLFNKYLFISGHKNGTITLWDIPSYNLSCKFEVLTEELLALDHCNINNVLAASFTENLRFFSLSNNNERVIGKYKPLLPYIQIKYLPDGNFLFALDESSTLFLIKIKYDNFLLHLHQIQNINLEVLNLQLSILDPFNKFFCSSINSVNIYNRKFTNILKSLSYENAMPQFYLLDKFDCNEYLNKDSNKNSLINNRFEFNFSDKEENIIIIFSYDTSIVLIRNFESHTINNIIKFDSVFNKFRQSLFIPYTSLLFKSNLFIII